MLQPGALHADHAWLYVHLNVPTPAHQADPNDHAGLGRALRLRAEVAWILTALRHHAIVKMVPATPTAALLNLMLKDSPSCSVSAEP